MKKHKHYKLINQYIQNPEVYKVFFRLDEYSSWDIITHPAWNPNVEYKLEKVTLTLDDYKDKTWYKNNISGHYIFIQKDKRFTYGFNKFGNMEFEHRGTYHFKYNNFHLHGRYEEVTDISIIEELFLKEAEKRYGDNWRNVKLKECTYLGNGNCHNNGSLGVGLYDTLLWNENGCLFNNGKWAEVLEEPKYEPYSFDDANNLIGKNVLSKTAKFIGLITAVNEIGIYINSRFFAFEEVLENYIDVYGKPFGKEGKDA